MEGAGGSGVFSRCSGRFRGLFLLLLLALLLLSLPGPASAADYDISFTDPSGDVSLFEDDAISTVGGHEGIDIISASMEEGQSGINVIVTITVVGTIRDDMNTTFMVMITEDLVDSDKMYMVTYGFGGCIGTSSFYEDFDVLVCQGEGTNSLEIHIPESKISDFQLLKFTVNSMWMEGTGDDFSMYSDYAPDNLFASPAGPYGIIIDSPINGSTQYGVVEFSGRTNVDFEPDGVEYMIDSASSFGWKAATTTDSWNTWHFSWDSSLAVDGWYEITVRIVGGDEPLFQKVLILTDQSQTTYQKAIVQFSTLTIGTEFKYKTSFLNGDYSAMGNLDASYVIESRESVKTGAGTFDAYRIKSDMVLGLSAEGMDIPGSDGVNMGMVMSTIQWVRADDLAAVKSAVSMSLELPVFGGNSQDPMTISMTSEAIPPLPVIETPMRVGDSSTRNSVARITQSDYGELEQFFSADDQAGLTQFTLCLRTEKVTVPAGTFDTFVIYTRGTSSLSIEMFAGTGGDTTTNATTVSYFSPELGYFVRMDSYQDGFQTAFMSMELEEIVAPRESTNQLFGALKPVSWFLVLAVSTVIILVVAMAVVAKRQRDSALLEEYLRTEGTPEEYSYLYPNRSLEPQPGRGYSLKEPVSHSLPDSTPPITAQLQASGQKYLPSQPAYGKQGQPPAHRPPVRPRMSVVTTSPVGVPAEISPSSEPSRGVSGKEFLPPASKRLQQLHCPVCEKEFYFRTDAEIITCSHCGASGALGE